MKAAIEPHEKVLEVAVGTGIDFRGIADRVGRVKLVDLPRLLNPVKGPHLRHYLDAKQR